MIDGVKEIYHGVLRGFIEDNPGKLMAKVGLLYSTFENISNKIAQYFYDVNKMLYHYAAWYGDDLAGSFVLSALYREILSRVDGIRISKYTPELSSFLSFASLSAIEMLQKYHIIPGVYDKKDIEMFALGSLFYLGYRKIKENIKEYLSHNNK